MYGTLGVVGSPKSDDGFSKAVGAFAMEQDDIEEQIERFRAEHEIDDKISVERVYMTSPSWAKLPGDWDQLVDSTRRLYRAAKELSGGGSGGGDVYFEVGGSVGRLQGGERAEANTLYVGDEGAYLADAAGREIPSKAFRKPRSEDDVLRKIMEEEVSRHATRKKGVKEGVAKANANLGPEVPSREGTKVKFLGAPDEDE